MCKILVQIFCLVPFIVYSQSNTTKEYSILFYNIENLFDCRHDTLKNDSEFLEGGYKNWSSYRMYHKLNGISKVIHASNGWNPPVLIGLCEVENSFVLKQLIYQTGLKNSNYKYIHYESPDRRGIDVALVFKKNEFIPIRSFPIGVSDSSSNFLTRDALYVKGIIHRTDTVHVFVNHWPSKRGGALASEHKRERVAQLISAKVDSIQKLNVKSKVIVMGDFNAEYSAPSIQKLINTNNLESVLKSKDIKQRRIAGSHKYQGHWSLIDHILISKHWINSAILHHKIVDLPFLLEDDLTYSGVKPKRTYAGPNYHGGVSDHLPVILTVKCKKEGEQ